MRKTYLLVMAAILLTAGLAVTAVLSTGAIASANEVEVMAFIPDEEASSMPETGGTALDIEPELSSRKIARKKALNYPRKKVRRDLPNPLQRKLCLPVRFRLNSRARRDTHPLLPDKHLQHPLPTRSLPPAPHPVRHLQRDPTLPLNHPQVIHPLHLPLDLPAILLHLLLRSLNRNLRPAILRQEKHCVFH